MTDLPHRLLHEISVILEEGGSSFAALLVLAFGIAFALLSLWRSTHLPDATVLAPSRWLALLRGKETDPESIASLRDHFDALPDRKRGIEEMEQRLFAKSRRRFPFAFILISAAPLIGLLGTVSGMFHTFRGMSTAAASAPIDVISDGISEALITTQTGLIIGVPSFIVCAWLKSRHEDLLAHYRQLSAKLLSTPAPRP